MVAGAENEIEAISGLTAQTLSVSARDFELQTEKRRGPRQAGGGADSQRLRYTAREPAAEGREDSQDSQVKLVQAWLMADCITAPPCTICSSSCEGTATSGTKLQGARGTDALRANITFPDASESYVLQLFLLLLTLSYMPQMRPGSTHDMQV